MAETLPAFPVVKRGEGWASFPSAVPAPGELVLKWRGETWLHPVRGLGEVNLGELWDRSELRYLEGSRPGGGVVGKPGLVSRPEPKKLRAVFTAIPEAAPEQKEYLRRLERPQERSQASNPLLGFLDLLGSFFQSKANRNYLSKMLSYFERGDWEKALRYAIPLDDSSPVSQRLNEFLGKFTPRKNLNFTPKLPGGLAAGTSMEGMDLLRSVYHNAYQALLQAGRIEEAAFVLAELLDDAKGAVELLERHGFYEKAAELATLKGLPASLQVALWFRAGKVEQALQVARCHYVHGQAIVTLENKDKEAARAFRVLWAQDLARVGQFGEAVLVGWPVRRVLPDCDEWVEATLDVGNLESYRVALLVLTSGDASRGFRLAARLRSWMEDTSPLTVTNRRKLLSILSRSGARTDDPEIREWAASTARRVLRQMNSPWPLGDKKTVDFLAKLSEDRWLKADLPYFTTGLKLQLNRWRHVVEERGHLPIFDAAPLGDGRILVALGHAGLLVLSSRGARSQQFSLPCHKLVAPLQGGSFLTLSRSQVGCFERGAVRSLCSVAVDGCADEHDGLAWFVWLGTSLYQIDLARLLCGDDPGWEALSETKLPHTPRRLSLGPGRVGVLLDKMAHFYRTPEMKLDRTRGLDDRVPNLLTPADGEVLSHRLEQWCFKGQGLYHQGHPVGLEYRDSHGVLYSKTEEGLTVCIFQMNHPKKQLALELPGARSAQVRVQDAQAIISDSCGRLLIADLTSQRWVGEFFL